MRRWFASVLLLLTALLPLQPLIASAQADGGLPACCRRNGVHHCMIDATTLANSGSQSSLRPSPCPLWKLTVSPALVAVAAAAPLLPSKPALAEDVVVLAPSFKLVRLAQTRSARAPPAAILSIVIFQA